MAEAQVAEAVKPPEPWNDPDAVPLIRIRDVVKTFDNFVALDDVWLDIYRSEFFSLLGPSGCGKTTLLRLLAGFEKPTSGTIEIDGVDMSDVPPYRRPVNMMFQSYALFPHMSVENNIAFGLRQEGVARGEISRRVREMLALVKLDELARRRPHQLSGGQKQRVAIARALAMSPQGLLCDEITSALDPELKNEVLSVLEGLQAEGMTLILVTHEIGFARRAADRVVVLAGLDHPALEDVDVAQELRNVERVGILVDFGRRADLHRAAAVHDGKAG
jgi:putrescine transport system ATP-binding protein